MLNGAGPDQVFHSEIADRRARTPSRGERRLFPHSLLLIACLILTGCGGSDAIRIAAGPFEATPVRIDSSGQRHIVVFTAPTGGWQARFDTDRRMFNGREVFITLTRPDPDAFHTQALTRLHVLTPVASDVEIDVYARAVPFRIADAEPPGLFGRSEAPEPPYRLAASTRANPQRERSDD